MLEPPAGCCVTLLAIRCHDDSSIHKLPWQPGPGGKSLKSVEEHCPLDRCPLQEGQASEDSATPYCVGQGTTTQTWNVF